LAGTTAAGATVESAAAETADEAETAAAGRPRAVEVAAELPSALPLSAT
jgi:hypothetical protein